MYLPRTFVYCRITSEGKGFETKSHVFSQLTQNPTRTRAVKGNAEGGEHETETGKNLNAAKMRDWVEASTRRDNCQVNL
jgi:hypothetical protein